MHGRSGPKSEAVVLTKSESGLNECLDRVEPGRLTGLYPLLVLAVDRVQELLATRVALLERLSRAYGQAHDVRMPMPAGPRKWEDKFVGTLEDGEDEGEWDDAGED